MHISVYILYIYIYMVCYITQKEEEIDQKKNNPRLIKVNDKKIKSKEPRVFSECLENIKIDL